MSWPSSTDPFYLANTSEQNARRTYYGVNSIPAGFGNGATIGGSASSWRSSGLSNIGSYVSLLILLSMNSLPGIYSSRLKKYFNSSFVKVNK